MRKMFPFDDDMMKGFCREIRTDWTGSEIMSNVSLLSRFDPDPTLRLNFYGVVFANMMAYVGYYGYLQIGVQRYSSLPTIEKARR